MNGSPAFASHLIYDTRDLLIAETDGAGTTLREYLWLDEIPVVVVDGANTATPTLLHVHVDHLGRPHLMTVAGQHPCKFNGRR